jgi:hypothetical protein
MVNEQTSDDAPSTTSSSMTGTLLPAALASTGAGVIHAAAIGIHTEHVGLTRLFILVAIAQIAAAVLAFIRPGTRAAAGVLVGVNLAAFSGWVYTRFGGISWIAGLEQSERAQAADTIAALLALGAVLGAGGFLVQRAHLLSRLPAATVAALVAVLTIPAMVSATSHQHDHRDDQAIGNGSTHGDAHGHDGRIEQLSAGLDVQGLGNHHDGGDGAVDHHDGDHRSVAGHDGAGHDGAGQDDGHHNGDSHDGDHARASEVGLLLPTWPRPWDPDQPFDFSGIPGVTPAQQARAERLVIDTLGTLPQFADVTTVGDRGYRSIGDSSTGFEHFINRDLIRDDVWLDPSAPESLVYRVDGDERVLVSAMFIVGGRAINDPELVDFGGPLMEWHVHDNLCWGLDDNGNAVVKAVTDNHGGVCPPGTVRAGGDAPMVHVWITPHMCGPFAALEGHGAGQAFADGSIRADQCHHGHGGGDGHGNGVAAVSPKLSGHHR